MRTTHSNLILKRVKGKGRGIFAARDFKKGEVVDISPIVKIPAKEVLLLEFTVLSLYTFGDDADGPGS